MYENIDKNKYTPMIRQYLTIKEQYPDTLVFYRVGDFYEMFFNDAIIASKEIELVLTKKDAGVTNDPVPMAGVPYHAVETYIQRLSDKGYRIAVVDQMEEPQQNKIVEREVTQIVTPGTNISENYLNEKTNNYIASISKGVNGYIFAYIDLSTGEQNITKLPNYFDAIYNEIYKLQIKEIVVSQALPKMLKEHLTNTMHILLSYVENNELESYMNDLYSKLPQEYHSTCIRLLNYIVNTQRRTLIHLKAFNLYSNNDHLKMDYNTIKNLELLLPIKDVNSKKTLFNVLDKCSTAMGSRYLKRTITYPLINKKKIERRLDIVSEFIKNYLYLDDLKKAFNEIYDLERIAGRVSYGTLSPKDLLQLKNSLHQLPIIKAILKKMKGENLNKISSDLLKFDDLYTLIDKSIREDSPFLLRDGGFIKDGYDVELDDIRLINSSNKDFLTTYETKERERTGIKNLKVGYNRVFGYYIEVSKGNIPQVKDEFGYIRKQTTTNSERYITQELKEKEAMILNSKELGIEIEIKLFNQIRDVVKEELINLQKTSLIISELDMLLAFSFVSKENNYVRPTFNSYGDINIVSGRHPVIEEYLKENFIPNDLEMNKTDCVLLITGPNMAGKSTYMRQNAIIAIMAQIGCFVPAKSAILPIFDQIFTRIGASDDIASGESTFMVEMNEVNFALKNATYNSLILFDEVGRGTATYDGMALAQSIIEYLCDKIFCKVLFSTHYHELTLLDSQIPNLKNVHVEAIEDNDKIIFMHKVLPNATDKSFGINVAKLANLPNDVIFRAKDILEKIINTNKIDIELISKKNYVKPQIIDNRDPKETKIIEDLKNTNVEELKPIDALLKLENYKKELDNE